jgi:putative DNA primase/helicase
MMPDLVMVARALRGVAVGRASVLAPGPGHSDNDRSLSVKLDPVARDGFVVHSFAGDSAIACRDYVRAALCIKTSNGTYKPARGAPSTTVDYSTDRSTLALRVWHAALEPRGTLVTTYLSSRGLSLPHDVGGAVVRYHPALKYNGGTIGGMVALFRDIKTNEPSAVHRTFLDSDGRKLDRGMLGRVKQAAIKIDADENVTAGLTIGEGFETCLAARLAGFRPVWAAGSAGSIATFPVRPGVEALTILGEVGDGGANQRATRTCADRWIKAGHEALVVTPLFGDDLNDAWREVAR